MPDEGSDADPVCNRGDFVNIAHYAPPSKSTAKTHTSICVDVEKIRCGYRSALQITGYL